MNPLVPASYAQFGVGAGGRRGICAAPADSGRPPMAWRTRPCFRGDLLLCTGVLPLWSSDLCTKQIENLHCGAKAACGRCNAVCRVACLAWAGWIGELMRELPGQGANAIPLKPCLQKRLRDGLTVVEIT